MRKLYSRYSDIFYVLLGTVLLTTINELLAIICKQKFSILMLSSIDVLNIGLVNTTIDWISTVSLAVIVSSLPLNIIAGYYSLMNDRLAFPIR
ncbi:unnamed protein product, partial [Mesorhabditis belari]|uniref:Uncharacterized protein n=1 Tax=Mesorhabditis belari TaxID=2138241 RepID=A0AAF3EI54_9BILA